jgi:hypothetical protein
LISATILASAAASKDCALVDPLEVARPGARALGRRRGVTKGDDVADDGRAQLVEQQLGQGAGGDAGGGLPGRGALEHVAGVLEAVLEHPGQVGVPGPRLGEHLARGAGLGRHLLGPLRPLGVGDLDRHGRAERAAVADAAEQRDLVGLEAHARAAPVAEAAPCQLVGDVGCLDGQAGGQALDDDDEGFPVGFAGGQEAQHVATLPDARTAIGGPITAVTRVG